MTSNEELVRVACDLMLDSSIADAGNPIPEAGADAPPPDGRNGRGQFAPGNRAALKHGGYSRQTAEALLPEQAPLRAILAEKRAAIVADLGGPGEVGAIKGDLLQRYLELHTLTSWLAENLMAHGVFTGKGKTRAAFSAYLQAYDRLLRMAQSIGLERHARNLTPPGPRDYVAAQASTPAHPEG